MFCLLLSVEGVEGSRWTVGEKWRELLGLKLLLDAMKLTTTGRHCRHRQQLIINLDNHQYVTLCWYAIHCALPKLDMCYLTAFFAVAALSLLECIQVPQLFIISIATHYKHSDSLISPLHCQVILLWQAAPGLLKSQAAQVASSTMADGCNNRK